MQDKEEVEAAVLELLEEMEGEHGDAHEIYLRLKQILDSMRAMGLPVPDDLARMERELAAEFEGEPLPDDGINDGG